MESGEEEIEEEQDFLAVPHNEVNNDASMNSSARIAAEFDIISSQGAQSARDNAVPSEEEEEEQNESSSSDSEAV